MNHELRCQEKNETSKPENPHKKRLFMTSIVFSQILHGSFSEWLKSLDRMPSKESAGGIRFLSYKDVHLNVAV